jgi:hypothetical protein
MPKKLNVNQKILKLVKQQLIKLLAKYQTIENKPLDMNSSLSFNGGNEKRKTHSWLLFIERSLNMAKDSNTNSV